MGTTFSTMGCWKTTITALLLLLRLQQSNAVTDTKWVLDAFDRQDDSYCVPENWKATDYSKSSDPLPFEGHAEANLGIKGICSVPKIKCEITDFPDTFLPGHTYQIKIESFQEQVYMEDKNKKSKIVSKKILPIGLQHKIVASSGTFVGPAKEIVCPAKEEFYKYLCKTNPERPCANTHGEELTSWFTWIAPPANKNIQNVNFHVACGHEKKLAYKCRPGSKRKIRCNATDVNPGGACEYNSGEECGPVSHGKLIVVGKSKQTCASKQKIKNDVRVNFDFNDTAKTGTLVVDVSSKSQFEAPS